jgi:hypothetical protein
MDLYRRSKCVPMQNAVLNFARNTTEVEQKWALPALAIFLTAQRYH